MQSEWTPSEYALARGWDFECIENTVRLGIADEDAEALTEDQQSELLVYCKAKVAGEL